MTGYLVFKDYTSHKFWQIEVTGNEFVVHYGKYGTEGRTQSKSFESHAEAIKESRKLISQKLKKGYVKKSGPIPIVYKKGVKVDATKAYKFCQDHSATDGTVIENLKDFFTQEDCDKVEEIVIGMWVHDENPDDILNVLIENKTKLKSVKHFFIGDIESEENEMSWIQQTNYELFLKEFSNIEKLELRGGEGLELGEFSLPNLKMLRIETGGMDNVLLEQLVASKDNLPNLEYLDLWLGTSDYGGTVKIETVQQLIAGDCFPKLKHLGLMNSDKQDDVVKIFEDHPLLDRLDELDFSMGVLTKEGGTSLLANEKLLELDSLRCVFNFMPPEMIKKLKKKFPNGDFDRSWADFDEEEEYRYVEVSE